MTYCRTSFFGVSVIVLTGLGCSKPEFKLPATVPYSGVVKLDGQPLAGASVTFVPTSKKEFVAVGATNTEGKYELVTAHPGVTKPAQGVVPGEYKVRISLSKTPDGKPVDLSKKGAMPGMESLKLEYSDTVKTTLKANVSDKGGTQDFELKSK